MDTDDNAITKCLLDHDAFAAIIARYHFRRPQGPHDASNRQSARTKADNLQALNARVERPAQCA